MNALMSQLPFGSVQGAIEFIFEPQYSNVTGGNKVGGIDKVIELMINQLQVTVISLAIAMLIAFPIALYLGHKHKFETVAIAFGNAGRGIPELALIAFMAAAIGVGLLNVAIALAVLGIPPILTNTFVGIHQVDRAAVDAARGMGMTEFEILRKVEIPLAIPTLMGGIRGAAVAIVATATIAPLAGYETLGDFIINENVYGENGVLAGAILVALLALALELALAGIQRLLTSPGLKPRPA
ncbi:MAG TPA: ABC transporter permease subunit [Solirubrobacterales bacterium]|jgi:osmoprotectant transport system permease protein|nr:ABC transporter permease subunit [Solirubrobacterales bacterium]